MDVRTTSHVDLAKIMFKDPEKFADFYRSTVEVLREDLEKEFDDVVTYSTIFLKMNKTDQTKWVNEMEKRWLKVMAEVNASMLDRFKTYIAWEHYHNLMTEQ